MPATLTLAPQGVESTEAYLALEALMVGYDADAEAPLKKGQEPFRWSHVLGETGELLNQAHDLRVAVWHLRAGMAQEGLAGLTQGLSTIDHCLQQPVDQIFPQPEPDEPACEAHAIALDWLGSPAFLALIRQLPLSADNPLTLNEIERSPTMLIHQHN